MKRIKIRIGGHEYNIPRPARRDLAVAFDNILIKSKMSSYSINGHVQSKLETILGCESKDLGEELKLFTRSQYSPWERKVPESILRLLAGQYGEGFWKEYRVMENIIDLSHHNEVDYFPRARWGGIMGIIHKATQGKRFKDPKYSERKQAALRRGHLWGAYHFGIGGSGVDQAKHFLDIVNPTTEDLLVLDFEPNPGGPSMSIFEAEEFVLYIEEQMGRYPGLYTGNIKISSEYMRQGLFSTLSKCWLWLAHWSRFPKVPEAWGDYTLWQHTDGTVGIDVRPVDGIGYCDRSKFQGSLSDLYKLWYS